MKGRSKKGMSGKKSATEEFGESQAAELLCSLQASGDRSEQVCGFLITFLISLRSLIFACKSKLDHPHLTIMYT